MKKHILSAIILASTLLWCQGCAGPAQQESSYRIVAYYPSYKAAESVIPEQTLRKITHVNFSFALPAADGSLEYSAVKKSVEKTAELTAKAGVKVLVSVGGGGGSELQHAFAAAIHDPESRDILIDNLMKMADELSLDGLDIDYEAWNLKDEAYDTELQAGLEDFLAKLKSRLGKERLLTAAVAAYGHYTGAMAESFDYITVMAYDLTGPWGTATGPHAPFEFFTSSLKQFQDLGFPAEKLVGGVPFYGRGFPTDDPKDAYAMTYAEIVEKFPGAENHDCVNDELWYDGLNGMEKKCQYIVDNGMGGIMFWEITQDTTDPEKSLLDKINSILR